MSRISQEYPIYVISDHSRIRLVVSYASADLRARVPDTDDPHISSNQHQTSTLLPVEDQPGVPVARYQVSQSAEGRHQLRLSLRVIVAENLDYAI